MSRVGGDRSPILDKGHRALACTGLQSLLEGIHYKQVRMITHQNLLKELGFRLKFMHKELILCESKFLLQTP
jgi:hypothetical protein